MARHNKYAITDAEFKLFIVLWNQQMNMGTPAIHFRIAQWLEDAWREERKNLLLMAFRSSGKSTIAGLFAAWLLYRRSDLRILVLAADFGLAKKMVRNVKRIIEKHPLTQNMKPARADQWAGDRFTVKRNITLRDPSMTAKGVTFNITGSRADIVICDDVEVPNTCDSSEKRELLRQRLKEISYVLTPGGSVIYIGTPHTYYTIYAEKPRKEIGEEEAFLYGFERLKIPLVDAAGEITWVEKYSPAMIEEIKRQTGPNKFASQMLLKPVNIIEGRLDPEALRFYDSKLHFSKELNQLYIDGKMMVSASAWWDPAFGSAGGDDSVLACLFTGEDGYYYLQRLEYIEVSPFKDQDEATQQCEKVAFTAQMLRLPSITVEDNGIGKLIPGILRNALSVNKVPCAVRPVSNSRPKHLRILEAFDPVLAARMLYVHERVRETPFLTEMREWRPDSKRGRDDGLDAVAGALSQEPVRISRKFPARGGHTWMRGKDGHKANTEFEV